MTESIPPSQKRRLFRGLLIALIVLFGLGIFGAGAIFYKIKSRPLSPQKQTFTFVAVHRMEIATQNAGSIFMVNPKDGEKMVFIPGGEFTMGTDSESAQENEKPAHTVFTDPFWIYQTQVTNAMFRVCVEAGVCIKHVGEVDPHFFDPEYDDHPVVYISWQEALSYCEWQGGRLPTEAEWEKAARGSSDRFYPWGEISAGPDVVNAANAVGDTTAVGSYPDFPSFYGVLDMGGNVREWVMDWFDPLYFSISPRENPTGSATGTEKVLRGAGYFDPYPMSETTNRASHEPASPGINRGFRCVIPIEIP